MGKEIKSRMTALPTKFAQLEGLARLAQLHREAASTSPDEWDECVKALQEHQDIVNDAFHKLEATITDLNQVTLGPGLPKRDQKLRDELREHAQSMVRECRPKLT